MSPPQCLVILLGLTLTFTDAHSVLYDPQHINDQTLSHLSADIQRHKRQIGFGFGDFSFFPDSSATGVRRSPLGGFFVLPSTGDNSQTVQLQQGTSTQRFRFNSGL